MYRSKWKGPYIAPKFLKTQINKQHAPVPIRISRNSKIVALFLGFTFKIYNGCKYVKLNVTEEMIGHKFGEFAQTRTIFQFKQKDKNGTKN